MKFDERLAEALELINNLLSSKEYYFRDLLPSMLEDKLAVVYVIFDKDSRETLYVGRTKNLRQRLYNNHLMGPATNARLKKYLIEDATQHEVTNMQEAKQYLKNHCYFQYIAEPIMQRRGQIEGLLSYLLDVKYIHEEH